MAWVDNLAGVAPHFGASAQTRLEDVKVRFFRITVLGASACGKTSLVSSFVNRNFPSRYVRTEKVQVYHKKSELPDETEYHEVLRPILLEIEDTPGSERGFDDDDDNTGPKAVKTDAAPKIMKGSRVVVVKEKQELLQLFDKFGQKSKGVLFKRGMENMLGKEFNVRSIGKDGSIYLPSPDGSEGGVWTFPPGAAKLKVSLTLPIDEFLHLAEKKEKACSSAKEKKEHMLSLQKPLSGYDRPVGAPDVDKTLTRNRMGYFICFDVSDDSMASLKEAMAVHKMLSESLEKAQTWSRHALSPHIWLVGCKSDKANSDEDVRKNRTHADAYAEQHDLICRVTSARQHKGVNEVFVEMLQAISSRTNLWTLDGDINEDEEDEDASGCFSQ